MMAEEERRARAREAQRRYQQRHPERVNETIRRYRKNNPERVREWQKRYALKKAEAIKAYRKEYYKKPEMRKCARERSNRFRKGLSDWDNAMRLAKQQIYRQTGVRYADMPRDIVEAKASHLLLKRQVRKLRKQQKA